MYLNVTRMHYHRSQNVTHLAENQKLKETFLLDLDILDAEARDTILVNLL